MKKILFILLFIGFHMGHGQSLTVRQVMDKILADMGTTIEAGSVDTLKSGTWDMNVTGIGTTFMTTLDVIKRAKAQGINLIFTHEPTYFNHLDHTNQYGQNDPVMAAKLQYIHDNGIVIFRFHDLPHQIADDMINEGMVRQLGWKDHLIGTMVFRSPYATVGELAGFLAGHFQTTTVRVVGDASQPVNKIGVLPGAYGPQTQIDSYNNPDIDVLIIGEAREWETIPYVWDAQELGTRRALIVMGHADSEEGGMKYVAEWLSGRFTGIPVQFIKAGNPLWSPE
ncbi:MAG: Nif3-like dinuclear metal center hexameric protein [Cyclobacteriaceae bacterium]|nr:Nif3-like dinuclear metal center hexameric protein [Cyclobacteriaceae bacterium]